MKKGLGFLALTLGFSIAAQALPAQIKDLNCSSLEGASGATRVSLAGTYQGQTYLTITNVNPFGFPFSQQAEVVKASLVGSSLVLDLYTVATQRMLRLSLDNGTNRGSLSASRGGSSIEMTCSADVQAVK